MRVLGFFDNLGNRTYEYTMCIISEEHFFYNYLKSIGC
jgi:hypothetical protein